MSSFPRVVHVIAPQDVGGAESVVRALAKARNATGAETAVAALVPPGSRHPFVEELEAEGIPVRAVQAVPRRYFSHMRELSLALDALGAQIVHTHIYHADVIGWLAARGRLPLVSTVHGITGRGVKNALFIQLDLAVLRRFHAVVCVSKALEHRLQSAGVPAERLYRIHNASISQPLVSRREARESLGLPQERPCIGFVGRLSHEKGPDVFVDALAGLGDDLVGGLIGDGPERSSVEERATELGISERVLLLGARPRAAELLTAFDVIVLSSRSEASPMIVFEALAAGIPLVAFDVGDVSAVLDHEVGWLVSAGDRGGLGKAIAEVLSDPDSAAAKARVGQERVAARFGAEAWIARLEEVYSRCVQG